ncbi:hypothetical protein Tco_0785260 [Tanacetum coccineum]
MEPLSSSQKRKPRRDRGTRKGRTSTSSTPAFGEPSSSHPTNDDKDVDHNEGYNVKHLVTRRQTHPVVSSESLVTFVELQAVGVVLQSALSVMPS